MSEESSIRKQIRDLLDRDPLLKPKQLCKLLGLPYKQYKNYVTSERYIWKKSYRFGLHLKGLSGDNFKNWRGWIYVDAVLDRKKDPAITERAIAAGWIQSRSRNRNIFWKDPKRGRLEWFLTGRVKIWVKKPADRGKANALLIQSFHWTDLISDPQIFQKLLGSVRFKGATLLIPTSVRLPYLKLDFLKDSNGLIFKMGDASHPRCIEINFFYPDWGEHSEAVVARFNNLLEKVPISKPQDPKKQNRMVV